MFCGADIDHSFSWVEVNTCEVTRGNDVPHISQPSTTGALPGCDMSWHWRFAKSGHVMSAENVCHQSVRTKQSLCHKPTSNHLPLCSQTKLKPNYGACFTNNAKQSLAHSTADDTEKYTRLIWPCQHQSLRTSCSTHTQQFSKAAKSCITNITPINPLQSETAHGSLPCHW